MPSFSASNDGKTKSSKLTIRKPLHKLTKRERDRFLYAWKLLKERDPKGDRKSYFAIGSYHGMPFDKGDVGENGWGGYCQHANVLFPSWHRYYCLEMENALKNAMLEYIRRTYKENATEEDVLDIALHYWDETIDVTGKTEAEQKKILIPSIMTDEKVTIDVVIGLNKDGSEKTERKTIPNPLLSFKLPFPIPLPTDDDDNIYTKPEKEYETCRFPRSGIQFPPNQKKWAEYHNQALMSHLKQTGQTLTDLFEHNLLSTMVVKGNKKTPTTTLYKQCLEEPSFNKFSNVSSGKDNLENPHNDIHLAIGGYAQFDIENNLDNDPDLRDKVGHLKYGNASGTTYSGANGDMGANEVASFDPIFYLHHSNVDRMFWVWQKKWGKTDSVEITYDEGDNGAIVYAGTGGQGPSPGQKLHQKLTVDTPMPPFYDVGGVTYKTTRGCLNIRTQLKYDYEIGSLDKTDEQWACERKYRCYKPRKTKPIPAAMPILPSGGQTNTVYSGDNNQFSMADNLKEVLYNLQMEVEANDDDDDDLISIKEKYASLGGETADYAHWPKEFKSPDGKFSLGGKQFEYSFQAVVENINHNDFKGSFIVVCGHKDVSDDHGGKVIWQVIGQKAFLGRWNKKNCGNCQSRNLLSVEFDLGTKAPLKNSFNVWLVTRDKDTHKFVMDPAIPYKVDDVGGILFDNSNISISYQIEINELASK